MNFQSGERPFFEELMETVAESGEIGDAFPDMVAYNVPLYVLRRFWPAEHKHINSHFSFPAFCIAEENWRGRIENVHATLQRTGGHFRLNFKKTYVMTAEVLYVFAKSDDEFAICRVSGAPSSDISWQSRNETDVQFTSTEGRFVDHSIVNGEVRMTADDFVKVTKKQYTPAGVLIPRREFTGLALLAAGMLRHYEIKIPETDQRVEEILQSREDDHLNSEIMATSRKLLDSFYEKTKGKKVHPFWTRARKMFFSE